MQKPVVDALEAAANVKAGMSDAQLMKKYCISAEGLQSLFRKLVSSGMLKPSEIQARLAAETVFIDLATLDKTNSAEEFPIVLGSQNACLLAITTNLTVLGLATAWAHEHGMQLVNCGDGGLGAGISKMLRPTMVLVELLLSSRADLDALHEACADTPIILLSRTDERDLLDQCLESGAHSFVDLPSSKKAFIHTLDRALEYGKLLALKQDAESLAEEGKKMEIAGAVNPNDLPQTILDSVTTVSVIMCDLDHNVLYWNKGAERIFGYTSEEMIGKKITRLYPPNSSTKDSLDEIHKRVEAKAGPIRAKMKQVTKDHRLLTILLALSPVLSEDGAVKAIVGIGMDITDKVRKDTKIFQVIRSKRKIKTEGAA